MGEFVVRIEIGLAETGEMFDGSEHSCRTQSAEKFAGVDSGLPGIARYRARAHHFARCFKCQIHNRRKVRVETQGPTGFADGLPMFAIQSTIAGGEHFCRGRRGSGEIAKAIYPATFHVHRREQMSRSPCPAFLEQPVGLFAMNDIAREKYHTRRFEPREQGTEPRRHLGAVEAHDEQLADLSGD